MVSGQTVFDSLVLLYYTLVLIFQFVEMTIKCKPLRVYGVSYGQASFLMVGSWYVLTSHKSSFIFHAATTRTLRKYTNITDGAFFSGDLPVVKVGGVVKEAALTRLYSTVLGEAQLHPILA